MKKVLVLISILFLFIALAGCDFLTFTTTTALTTTGATTSDPRLAELDAEFALLESALPAAIIDDYVLPVPTNQAITVAYTVNGTPIGGTLVYDAPSEDTTFLLKMTIAFGDLSDSRTYQVLFASDSQSYEEYLAMMEELESLPRIPDLYIWTDGNSEVTSKEDYISGTASLYTYDEDNVAQTVFEYRSLQIRGRGNSTWYMPKKPYKIKFAEKTALFTDYAARDWVLLANFTDQTLIRNFLAYRFAAAIGMEYTPSATFVDLYMNGVYAGNYMISDQIEASSVRIDIEEESSAVNTGYLLEMDKRLDSWPEGVEGIDWFRIYGVPYVVKSPQPDGDEHRLTSIQFDYIEDFIATVHITLMNQRDYAPYIDEASFIDWFIVQEVFKNVDSGYSSVFLYKDTDGPLKMGPIWDFDLSSSNPGHLDAVNRAPAGWYTSLEYKNVWFYYLMKYPTFRLHLQERWNELYETEVLGMLSSVYPAADAIARSRHLNFELWDVIGKNWDWYTSTEVYDAKTYEDQMSLLFDWLERRISWMHRTINDEDFV